MNERCISIIIHGPYTDNAYKEIFRSLLPVERYLKQVIVSTYIDCMEETQEAIKKHCRLKCVEAIFNKDIINPGYFNLNRQIMTVRAGLEKVSGGSFVIKLRNDQWCDMKKLLKCINRRYFRKHENHRIVSTNCFTRIDRFYHPSDMFLCGWKEDMDLYFSMSYQESTHMDIQLEMLKKLKYSYEPFNTFLVSPESELFKHYLGIKGWELQFTQSDSFKALKKYICIINTWDINLRWNKQRNAFLPAKTIILPYSFTMEPLVGAPAECAKCYARHSFEGHKTVRDSWFIFYSRVVFSIKYNRIHRLLVKMKNHTPRVIKRIMVKTPIGKFFKSVT